MELLQVLLINLLTLFHPIHKGEEKKKKGQYHSTPVSQVSYVISTSMYPPSGPVRIAHAPQQKIVCGTCGRLHGGQCRLGQDVCYKYGQHGHFSRDCSQWTAQQSAPSVAPIPIQIEGPRGQGSVEKGRAQTQSAGLS